MIYLRLDKLFKTTVCDCTGDSIIDGEVIDCRPGIIAYISNVNGFNVFNCTLVFFILGFFFTAPIFI